MYDVKRIVVSFYIGLVCILPTATLADSNMDFYIDMISDSGGPGKEVKYPAVWDKEPSFITALTKWKQGCITNNGMPVFSQADSDNVYGCDKITSGSEEDVIREYINKSKKTIHVGETIVISKQKYSSSASIRDKISDWEKACEKVRAPQSDNIDSAFSTANTNGNFYIYTCKVRLCKNGYTEGPAALSCVTGGYSSGSSGSGGSSGGGTSLFAGDNASTIRNKAKNISIGAQISLDAKHLNKSQDLQNAFIRWSKACAEMNHTSPVAETRGNIIGSGSDGTTIYECQITACEGDYKPASNKLSCVSSGGSGGGSSSGGSGGGISLFAGDNASTIRNKAKSISIGAKISLDAKHLNKSQDLQYAFKDWGKACAEMNHTSPVAETRNKAIGSDSDGTTIYECQITACEGNYKPAANKLSCVLSSGSSSGGGSGGGAAASATDPKETSLVSDIERQTKHVKVGESVFVENNMEVTSINVKNALTKWKNACKAAKKKGTIVNWESELVGSNGHKYNCNVVDCEDAAYEPASNKRSCVKKQGTSSATTGPVAGAKGSLTDVNQMVDGQINKSSGSMSSDNIPSGERSIGTLITEINTSAKNIKIGEIAFSYPEKMVSTGGMQLQQAITNWIARCTEYPQKHEEAVIKTTTQKKTKEKDIISHACVIEKCNSDYYVIAADGKSCEREKTTDISGLPKSRSASDVLKPAEIERLPNREITKVADNINLYIDSIEDMAAQMYIGAWITFTKDDLKNDKLSAAVNKWEAKCNSYPEDTNDLTVNVTYVKKEKDSKVNTWHCFIKSCSEDEAGLPQKPSDDGQSCISMDGTSCKAGDRHADKTHYDARNNKCIIDSCKEDFTLTPEGKCEKTKKLEKKAAKAESRLEKDFVSDIEKLSDAFEKVVKKLTKECEQTGGKINNGICEGAPAPDPKSKATTNRRGSGRK